MPKSSQRTFGSREQDTKSSKAPVVKRRLLTLCPKALDPEPCEIDPDPISRNSFLKIKVNVEGFYLLIDIPTLR